MLSKLRDACPQFVKLAVAAMLATPLASPAGTPQLVRDINPRGHAEPGEFVEFDGRLVFAAFDGINGKELWISDGTAAGTRMLADINPGPAGSSPQYFVVANGALYFRAYDGIAGRLMRLTSATAQPEILGGITGQVERLTRSCEWDRPVAVNSDVYYITTMAGVGNLGLYTSDGTAAGSAVVIGTLDSVCHLAAYKNRVYFFGSFDDDQYGNGELWSSSGTNMDTAQVADIAPGVMSSNPQGMIVFNDLLYFTATTNYADNLWRSDGTEAGTVEAAHINENPGTLRIRGILNGRLLIQSVVSDYDTVDLPNRFWVSDGSTANTSMLLSFLSRGTRSSTRGSPNDVLVGPTHAYFAATDARGHEPWVTDGTPEGTHLLKDLNPNGDSNPEWFGDFNGVTLIGTNNQAQGSQLWRSDGTADGTVLIGNVPKPWTYQGPGETKPFGRRMYLSVGQKFFFVGDDPNTGTELYVLTNDAPVTGADTATTSNGAAVTINVLANDTDGDGKIVADSISIATQPSHGTVTANADGTLTYTPTAGYTGTDTFGYRVTDNQGATSNTTTVTINPPPASSGGGDGGSARRGGGGSMRATELLALVALLMLCLSAGGARRQRTAAAR